MQYLWKMAPQEAVEFHRLLRSVFKLFKLGRLATNKYQEGKQNSIPRVRAVFIK